MENGTIKFSFAENAIDRSKLLGALSEIRVAHESQKAYADAKKEIFAGLSEQLGISQSTESKKALRQFVRSFVTGEMVELGQQLEAVSELLSVTTEV